MLLPNIPTPHHFGPFLLGEKYTKPPCYQLAYSNLTATLQRGTKNHYLKTAFAAH